MGSASSYMSLFLLGMRLVGGFPFVKKRRAKSVNEAKLNHSNTYEDGKKQPTFFTLNNKEDDVVFQKSSFWIYWTAMVGVAAILFFVLGFWNLQYPAVGISKHLAVIFYAYKINQVNNNVTTAGLMMYLICKRSLLRQVVEFLYHILHGRDNDAAIPNFPLSMIFPLIVNLASVLALTILFITFHVFRMTTISGISQGIAFFLLGTTILLLLQLVFFLSIHEYNCIITSLQSCLRDASLNLGLKHHYEYREVTSLCMFKNKVMHRSDIWAKPIYPARNRDLANPFEIDHRLFEAKERVTQINQLLHLVNKYCGVPVTLMMLISVISCILSLFYLSFLFQLDAGNIAITFCYIINSLLTPIFFCNAPYTFEEKHQELKFILRTFQYNSNNKYIRTRLRHLLGLLEVTPPSTMLGLFTLSRGNITCVLGFISTYVVILLQFRFTETSEKTSATNITTASIPTLAAFTGPPIQN